MLLNDFENFFNKEDLVYVGKRQEGRPNDLYQNTKTGFGFVHDFSLNSNLDEEYPKVQQKFERRVKRLLDKIKINKKVLIVYMELFYPAYEPVSNNKLINFVKLINKKFNKETIDILYIRHNENFKNGEFVFEELNKNVTVAQCFNRKIYCAQTTMGNIKNVRRILNFIKYNN